MNNTHHALLEKQGSMTFAGHCHVRLQSSGIFSFTSDKTGLFGMVQHLAPSSRRKSACYPGRSLLLSATLMAWASDQKRLCLITTSKTLGLEPFPGSGACRVVFARLVPDTQYVAGLRHEMFSKKLGGFYLDFRWGFCGQGAIPEPQTLVLPGGLFYFKLWRICLRFATCFVRPPTVRLCTVKFGHLT